MSNHKMPDGWTRVKFGDVVHNVNENSRDLTADGLDRVVGLDHLDPGSLRLERWDSLESLPDGTTFTRKFKPGHVLFGKRRAYQRKVAVPDFEGVCSGDILVFEPADERMLAEFLPYFVQSDGFFDHALGTSAGSLSPRTKWAELAKYEFCLPPIEEQQRIVRLARAAGNTVASVRRALESCSRMEYSLLEQLNRVARSWPTNFIGTVASVQLGRQLAPQYRLGLRPVPYVRAANLVDGQVLLDDLNEMDFTEADQERYRIRTDDILVVEGGDPDAVGAPALVRSVPLHPVCAQKSVIRVRSLDPRATDPRFLFWYLRSLFVAGEFERLASGTKLHHFTREKLMRIQIPMIDLRTQHEVSDPLEHNFGLKTHLAQHQREASAARQAVMRAVLDAEVSGVQ